MNPFIRAQKMRRGIIHDKMTKGDKKKSFLANIVIFQG